MLRISALSLMLCAPGSVLASNQICGLPEGVITTNNWQTLPEDGGNGFVMNWVSSFGVDFIGRDSFGVVDCKSNSMIIATFQSRDIADRDAHRARIERIWSYLQSDDEVHDQNAVLYSFTQEGAEATFRDAATNNEFCGCAVFYPELIGDKVPFAEHGRI